MFYRECRKCGHPMDPGEGIGNVCDDCVRAEAERNDREAEMELLLSHGPGIEFRKMEMSDFF